MKHIFVCFLLISSAAHLSAAEPPSEYQIRVARLRESLYGRGGDDLTTPPKLDEATRNRLTVELLFLDPYCELEQQLIGLLNAIDKHDHGDKTLTAMRQACVDILSLVQVWSRRRIPPSKEKAKDEVAQLVTCLFDRDVTKAEKLLKTWNQ